MTVLRPLRLGELLDRAVRVYRQNFLQFVGIVALVQVPITLVQIIVSVTTFGSAFTRLDDILNNPAVKPEDPLAVFGPAYFAGASLSSAVGILGFILLQGVATAALTVAVAGSYLGDPVPMILDAYRRVKHKWLSLVGALLLAIALAIGLGIWWLVPCFGWFTGGGMLLYLWYVLVPLLAPIVVLEDKAPTVAWRRAWTLARGRFWWVLAFALILYFFNLLVVAGPAAIVSVGGQFLSGNPFDMSGEHFTLQTIAQAVTVLITGLFYLPLQVASMTLLYFDLRVRTEGLDLAMAAVSLSEAGQPRLALTGLFPADDREPLLTSLDWRNFILLTLGGVFSLVVLYALILVAAIALVTAAGPL